MEEDERLKSGIGVGDEFMSEDPTVVKAEVLDAIEHDGEDEKEAPLLPEREDGEGILDDSTDLSDEAPPPEKPTTKRLRAKYVDEKTKMDEEKECESLDDESSDHEVDLRKSKKSKKRDSSVPEMPDVKVIIESVFGGRPDESILEGGGSWEEELEKSGYMEIYRAMEDLKRNIKHRRFLLREKKRKAVAMDESEGAIDELNIIPDVARRRRNSLKSSSESEVSKLEKQVAERNAAIDEFLNAMSVAAEIDRRENISKRPALNKMNLLSKFKNGLLRSDWQNRLLETGVLKVVHAWLEPLPDKTLPNPVIRETLLHVLKEFPHIDMGLLKESNLGKIVNFYANQETIMSIKNMAESLVSTWMTSNYSPSDKRARKFMRLNEEQSIYYSKQVRTGRRIKEASKAESKERSRGPLYASAPLLIPMDFIKQPKSEVEFDGEMAGVDGGRHRRSFGAGSNLGVAEMLEGSRRG